MELSKIQQGEELSWLRSAKTDEGETIIKSINLKAIPDIVKDKILSNYIPLNL